VNQRAMYRSQTGVLALLYTSNEDIDSAERSLSRAQKLFSDNDLLELSTVSAKLGEQAY